MTLSEAGLEVVPTVKFVRLVTVRVLDLVPLPLLVVIFLACLALRRWPNYPPPSLLPTFTPPTADKTRLSPSASSLMGHFGPGGKGQQQQVVVPQPKGPNVRRGSKQLREWRSGLGVVEEVDGEMAEREMV